MRKPAPKKVHSLINEWVSRIKEAYPHLPDHITPELEDKHLTTLEPWLERVRSYWGASADEEDEVLATANPNRTRDLGQMGPVLLALDEAPLSEEAITAWNELFVMYSAFLGATAQAYYVRYCAGKSVMDLEDVLGYMPISFLYSLSGFDRSRGTRLFTYIYQQAPRHLRVYLELYGNPIRQGSNHTIRYRTRAFRTSQMMEVRDGYAPSLDMLIAELRKNPSKTHQETAAQIERHGDVFLNPPTQESLSQAPDLRTGDATPFRETKADRLSARAVDTEAIFDPIDYLRQRAGPATALALAGQRLLETPLQLSTEERFVLGL